MEIEEKAKRMGWVPKEDFKGDEDKWVDAERFVERGENELPILRERLKKLDSTVASQNKAISEMNSTFAAFQKYHTDVTKKAYEKALNDIAEKQRKAAEEGDLAGYDRLEKAKSELEIESPPAVPKSVATGDTEFQEWVTDNKWFDTDPELRQYAASISGYYETAKGLNGRQLYDEVAKDVKTRFPDRFGNPKRNTPSPVEGAGEVPPAIKKRSYSNLPADAKAACDKFVKQIPGFTREQYVSEYAWEE